MSGWGVVEELVFGSPDADGVAVVEVVVPKPAVPAADGLFANGLSDAGATAVG